jgi:hypothetical protein
MKSAIAKLVADAEREELYGKITLEFRRGVITLVRTEKTQVLSSTEERSITSERNSNR